MQNASFQLMRRVEKDHWWWRVRRLLVKQLLKEYFKKTGAEVKILDLGCGIGQTSKMLEGYGEVYSLDASAEAVRYCREIGLKNVLSGDAENLPFADDAFDLVVALDVLEHVQNDAAAVKEIRRVLKKNGLFVCFVPALRALWSEQDEILKHFRRYDKKSFSGLFAGGWITEKISFFNFFLFFPVFVWRTVLKLSGKKQKKDEAEKFSFLNKVFYFIFRSESPVLKIINLPIGVSILGVVRKITDNGD